MRIAQIQFFQWDKVYDFDQNGLNLKKGDKVIVKTELGLEIGDIIKLIDTEAKGCHSCGGCSTGKVEEKDLKPVLRIANVQDLEKVPTQGEKDDALDFCKRTVERLGLDMKVVDVHFAFDGSRLTFAFIADGRVDFRELVKELTRHFNKNIRMQQIGIRDEAKVMGDCGPCGRKLCCSSFLTSMISITSEMAEVQQIAHRGSDRLSGCCGRLKCCLSYEIEGYEYLKGKMPPMGARVNVDGARGIVVGHHVLKQSVDVEFAPEKEGDRPFRVEVDLTRNNRAGCPKA